MADKGQLVQTDDYTGAKTLLEDIGGGFHAPVVVARVVGGGGGTGSGVDREIVLNLYRAKTAFTGAAVGDIVSSVRVLDLTVVPPTQSGTTMWYNETQQAAISGTPSGSNLEPIATGGGLTNAQLLAAGLATASQQTTLQTAIDKIEGRTPALGAKEVVGSVPVTLATNDPAIGAAVTAAGTPGTGGSGLLGWLSGIWLRLAPGNKAMAASLPVTLASDDTAVGAAVTAAGTPGTGGSGMLGWLSAIVLRLAPGNKAMAASLPVTLASDDAQIGTKVTVVPALATGGTGLIGWLSAVWQAIVNQGNQLPATIGRKVSTASMSVVLASDDALIGTPQTASTALSAGGTGIIGWLSSVRDTLLGLLTVNTLAQPSVARRLAVNAAGGASASMTLTTTCRRVSIVAVATSQRYVVGTGTPAATATSHFIMAGERLDIAVPANGVIASLSDTSAAGFMEITELS